MKKEKCPRKQKFSKTIVKIRENEKPDKQKIFKNIAFQKMKKNLNKIIFQKMFPRKRKKFTKNCKNSEKEKNSEKMEIFEKKVHKIVKKRYKLFQKRRKFSTKQKITNFNFERNLKNQKNLEKFENKLKISK